MKNCLICNTETIPYLSLGDQALANSYHDGKKKQKKYPLGVAFCPNCSHSQLTYNVDPKEQFVDYPYVSGTSETLREFFRNLADQFDEKNILEIASNDGTLLEYFKKKGCTVLGVDPAENLKQLSEEKGVPVVNEFWNTKVAKSLKKKFDLVLAINVLPHVPDPVDFLNACKLVSDKIYIQTSQCSMFKNREFDAIYHEHRSYFTAESLRVLASKVGLIITDFKLLDIHSQSFGIILEPKGEMSLSLLAYLETEEEYHDFSAYEAFASQSIENANRLKAVVHDFKRQGYKVIGYGASAKGNTVLGFTGIELDYIVDDNPLKHNLLTPGTNIPILSPDVLTNETEPVAILMLAWNFSTEIEQKISKLLNVNHYHLIKLFPEVKSYYAS